MNTKALIKKTKQLKYNRSATPFQHIHSVLLCWDSNQPRSEIEELKTFGHEMRKAGKEITFLAFHAIKKLTPDMQPNALHQLVCRGDFNLFKAPKSKYLLDILNQPYDLLINGCLTENEYLNTISVFSKSKFRIGPYLSNDETAFYELLIKPNGADLCENYLIEIGKYLQKIK